MYCPECRCEYEDGIKVCADCKIDLVEGLPPEEIKEDEQIKWVEVCNPLDLNQVIFIKSLLQSESIPFSIEGENLDRLYGPIRLVPLRVFVPRKYAKLALDLLKDLK